MIKAKKVKINYFEDFESSYSQSISLKKICSILIIIIVIISMVFSFIFFKKNKYLEGSEAKQYDYLIVGSGLYGATFNYFAKKAGKRTLVIEKKYHVGGIYIVQE
jgi:NADPH-dependent 2,4-dienoyl-CoA reductase/sulfur reductase-like enzyme